MKKDQKGKKEGVWREETDIRKKGIRIMQKYKRNGCMHKWGAFIPVNSMLRELLTFLPV